MKITRQEVIHVANLSHLELDETEIQLFSEQLGTILDYFEKLNQVDTRKVESTLNASGLTPAFREDEHESHLDRDAALSNAPEKNDGLFVVPRIIG